jgi:hypothetical protein
MVRGKGAAPGTVEFQKQAAAAQKTAPLSHTEIATLEDEQKEIQSTIREAEDKDRAVGIDVAQLKARADHIDRELEARAVESVRGVNKDKIVREEREIEDFLVSSGMPTQYEMDHPARCPGAVRKHLKWLDRTRKAVARYVEIQKILRPEEPKSIEALRKEK